MNNLILCVVLLSALVCLSIAKLHHRHGHSSERTNTSVNKRDNKSGGGADSGEWVEELSIVSSRESVWRNIQKVLKEQSEEHKRKQASRQALLLRELAANNQTAPAYVANIAESESASYEITVSRETIAGIKSSPPKHRRAKYRHRHRSRELHSGRRQQHHIQHLNE